MKKININLKELDAMKKRNFKERLKFVAFWARYIKNNPDEDWSEQQNVVIDSQSNF